MRSLDLSIIVITFLRPQCLDNFLTSVNDYQNKNDFQFDEIIIIDDSDEENQILNKRIVEKYSKMNLNYCRFEPNSLGVAKARNAGMNLVKTKYLLMCDDDFILDGNCSIEKNLSVLQNKDLDILGGYYRDIQTIDSQDFSISNWMGFIKENNDFDICMIYPQLIPYFCNCDIVQNFYLADVQRIQELRYLEELFQLEHNIFFLTAKQKDLKVAFTSQLWVKHFNIKNTNYSSFRNKEVINPLKKPVLGYLIFEDKIIHFNDYINICGEEFLKNMPQKKRMKWNFLLFKAEIDSPFMAKTKRLLLKIKNWKKGKEEFSKNKQTLEKFEKEYPRVLSTTETLKKIIDEKKSIARFGDGELRLILGQSLGKVGSFNEYQIYNEKLSERLKHILKNPTDNCLVAINRFTDPNNDETICENNLTYWENYWLDYWPELKKYYNNEYTYYSSSLTRLSVFKENPLEDIKKIWEDKKVLFVVGDGSHFIEEDRLFNNVKQSEFLIARGKSSFQEYDDTIEKIKKYDKDWLILIALGPSATILAYDLSQDGYQALDIGHLPNCYLQFLGEKESPENEHPKGRQFSKR